MTELFQKNIANALATVIELANQNVIDDPDMQEETDSQNQAIDTVQEYLDLLNAGTELTKAATELEELAGVDVDTFMDRIENSNDDYLGWWKPLYEKMARLIETAKQPTMLEMSEKECRVELHSSGEGEPNNKPLLKVFKNDVLIATLVLSGFTSCSQWLFEGELRHNFGLTPDDKQYGQRLKQVRKALGYSYP